MSLFSRAQRVIAETVSELTFCNPFQPRRIELEKKALGKAFDPDTPPYWSVTWNNDVERVNVIRLTELVFKVTEAARLKIANGYHPTDSEFQLYDDLAHYVIYYGAIANTNEQPLSESWAASWPAFDQAFEHWLKIGSTTMPSYAHKQHMFAYLSQVRRAFAIIFLCVVGRSRAVADLRARIWQSVFTHDMRRYRRTLFNRMNEIATMVIGPSGTGKELVARSIGLSQYRPFDMKKMEFVNQNDELFFALNLSALSPMLIESELFGHAKGAFTGATTKRNGFLESAGRYGCVFLDEIGELDTSVQVKLLRVLQSRRFQRVGENRSYEFCGKIVSATNRNLQTELRNGNFRQDFYYRLCSDVILTPSLAEQLRDEPGELEFLIQFICSRLAPGEEDQLRSEVLNWAEKKLPKDYTWPGNMRELEQCVRNIMIHNDYQPAKTAASGASSLTDPVTIDLAHRIANFEITADQLTAAYCQLVYQKTKSYEKAAQFLGMDRRTVKSRIDSLEML